MSWEIGGLGSSNDDKRSYRRQKFCWIILPLKTFESAQITSCRNSKLLLKRKEGWPNTEYYEIIGLSIDSIWSSTYNNKKWFVNLI